VVRRVLAADEKPLHWVGSSKRDFLSFLAAVKKTWEMPSALRSSEGRLRRRKNQVLEARKLSQAAAAKVLGATRPRSLRFVTISWRASQSNA
jgi:predicted XRE-type DNA-binding protein